MIKFTTLTLKNFLSYGNVPTIFQLDRSGTTLILGEDLDSTTDGQGANGVGKTVLINALAYGVYDKPISDISKDNLVNNINKKNMEVTVEFEKDGKVYRITRVRKSKAGAAGNFVQLFEDDHDITPDSVSNTNKLIEKIIGIPYELFVRIVVFSATLIPFLDLPVRSHYAANQTDIIEELFELKTLSEKAVALKETTKATEQRLDIQIVRVDTLKKEHARHVKQIESAEGRVHNWQANTDKEIATIEEKLNKIDSVDIDGQRVLHEKISEIHDLLSRSVTEQSVIYNDISNLDKKRTKSENELSHLQDEKCPYCLQKYADANEKIEESSVRINEYIELIDELEAELESSEDTIIDLTKKRKKLQAKVIVNDLAELIDIKNKSDEYQRKLVDLTKATNPFIEPLDELRAAELDELNMDEINTLTEAIDHQKFLLKLLTRKDSFVRKALLHKNIPFLNTRLQGYLTDLGLPHTVEFTHEMTASISQFGRPMDFGNLSNGQRARVNLALSFAFRDVLQSMHERVNVCMLDEVLDVGLDTVGVTSAARMLKRKARDEGLSLYIISHRDEIDSAFDRTMTVQMQKGFSYISEEE